MSVQNFTDLNSLKNSRDINVLKDVGQAKLCLMKLFIDCCPLRLTATSLFVPFSYNFGVILIGGLVLDMIGQGHLISF